MPTIQVCILEPWQPGYEGAWILEAGLLTVAQEGTLQAVLAAVDPDLLTKSGSATPAVSANAACVTYTAIAGDRLRGIIATSDRMARFRLTVTGRDPLDFRCEVAQPATPILLPGSMKLTVGDVVTVTAYNESDQGTANCAACLIWRNDA